jgi:cysteine synthase
MGRKTDSGFSDNQVTLDALGDIAREVKEKIDYYIPAVGNGSSVLGPGRIFKERGAKIVAFESFQSAVAYDKLYSGKYENEFGIKPGTLPRHKLRGTSYQGINFPHIAHAFEQKLIDEVYLVSDKDKDADYKKLTHKNPPILPHWDSIPKGEYGKSTRAGLAVALELAKKVKNKTMLVIWYDYANRYD